MPVFTTPAFDNPRRANSVLWPFKSREHGRLPCSVTTAVTATCPSAFQVTALSSEDPLRTRPDDPVRIFNRAGNRNPLDITNHHVPAAFQPAGRSGVDPAGEALAIDREFTDRKHPGPVWAVGLDGRAGGEGQATDPFGEAG